MSEPGSDTETVAAQVYALVPGEPFCFAVDKNGTQYFIHNGNMKGRRGASAWLSTQTVRKGDWLRGVPQLNGEKGWRLSEVTFLREGE